MVGEENGEEAALGEPSTVNSTALLPTLSPTCFTAGLEGFNFPLTVRGDFPAGEEDGCKDGSTSVFGLTEYNFVGVLTNPALLSSVFSAMTGLVEDTTGEVTLLKVKETSLSKRRELRVFRSAGRAVTAVDEVRGVVRVSVGAQLVLEARLVLVTDSSVHLDGERFKDRAEITGPGSSSEEDGSFSPHEGQNLKPGCNFVPH